MEKMLPTAIMSIIGTDMQVCPNMIHGCFRSTFCNLLSFGKDFK
jgi:hypothetical protein